MPMHLRRGALHLFFYIDYASTLLDAPTGYRVEGWGANSLPTRQAEARMMPRATHGVLYKETISKWSAVMRTRRANCEHFVAASDKEHRFSVCMAKQHGPVRNGGNLDPLREVWSAKFFNWLAHWTSPGILAGGARSRLLEN
jgi:hypothetical protein